MDNLATTRMFNIELLKCFTDTYSFIIVIGLVLFKTILPLFPVILFYRTINTVLRVPYTLTYPIIIFFTNLMGLQMFNGIKDEAWTLDQIGLSLIYFIIIELLTIFIIILYAVVKLCTYYLLCFSLCTGRNQK